MEHSGLDPILTMSTADAARRLQIHPATLRSWRSQGIGPAYTKVGRVARYRVVDLLDYLNLHRVSPEQGAK